MRKDMTTDALLTFEAYQQPALSDGTYQIMVNLYVTVPNAPVDGAYCIVRTFSVAGPRFQLDPSQIQAVFPVDGATDVNPDILPHVLFTRSTLPWERKAYAEASDPWPWVVILLFTESEAPAVQTVRLDALSSNASPWFPAITLENGQTGSDQTMVIDVPKSFLTQVLPGVQDIAYLAHVRATSMNDAPQDDGRVAAVIGNRLPRSPGRYFACLVSVENRYSASGFDYQGASNDDLIRLVCLKQWSFETSADSLDFAEILGALDRDHAALQLPPSGKNAQADAYLRAGYIAAPHHMRDAQQTASWYRGPLTSGPSASQLSLPASSSDALVFYDPASGMFDVSYAAAWELGRLLALQSQQVSSSLYRFKQAVTEQQCQIKQMAQYAHLPLRSRTAASWARANTALECPPSIIEWLQNKRLLQGVPFSYLVPDERMLPPESIRFFQVDSLWVNCLLDGAFAIGNVGHAIVERPVTANSNVSGFILRSSVVAGWPDLVMEATDAHDTALTLLRRDLLSNTVLIAFFAGTLQSVTLSPRPETLHFGVDPDLNDPTALVKPLRDESGDTLRINGESVTVPVPLRAQTIANVVDIEGLARNMSVELPGQTTGSAQFAFQLIEGAVGVKFNKTLTGSSS